MPIVASIKALPPSTVHRIGSSQVLVDSSSVVKELIDNSIDARATSISIEISTNTLDVIQVTDNGHGIIPEDRAMVCRRYTTSKISDFSDLIELGGSSLGFRGEALHSLANLSGGLMVTTRVEGEIAAVRLVIARTGEVEGRETASHPVGTSVRTTNFFNILPVRKQTALKAAPKTLTKIKRLLQAYALARPTIRFSLKVLKAKTTTGNLIYAPKAGASSVKDAVFKILGANCTSQCDWHVFQSHGFELQAFCPTPEAVPAKISNTGQFLSVDSRPMSTSRCTMKQIVSLFKDKLRKSSACHDSVKDPFLCLNIVCPKASYDPNVEPSKDDVLFDDSGKVTAAVNELFTTIYPAREREQQEQTVESPLPEVERVADSVTAGPPQSFQRQHPVEIPVPPVKQMPKTTDDDFGDDVVLDDEELTFLEQRALTPAWRSNMYGCDEEDLELLANINNRRATAASQEIEDPREAAREVNPWSIAKMNAPVRRNTTKNGHSPIRPGRGSDETEFNASLTPVYHNRGHLHITPSNSWTAINHRQIDAQSPPPATAARRSQIAAFGLPTPHPSSSPAVGTSLKAIPEVATRTRPTRTNPNIDKPFVNPLRDSNWDFGPPSWPKRKAKPQGDRSNKDIRDAFGGIVSRRPPRELPLVIQGESTEEVAPSNDAMLHEFNVRLGEREQTNGSARKTRDIGNVHRQPIVENNVETSRRVLRTRSRTKDDNQNSAVLPSDDVQPPPAKRCRTTEGGRRSKSSRLPLERVPENQQTHRLTLMARISLKDITTDISRLNSFDIVSNSVPWDFSTEGAYNTFEDGVEKDEVKAWSKRIKGLLEKELERFEVETEEEKTLVCVGALSRLERAAKGMEVLDVI